MLESVWTKENSTPLLVGVQTCTAALEINMVVSQQNWKSIYLKTQLTNLGHILKGYLIIPQGHLFNYVRCSIVHNSQNLETTLMSFDQRMGGACTQ